MWIEERTIYVVIDDEGDEVDSFDDYRDAERCIENRKEDEDYREMVMNERW